MTESTDTAPAVRDATNLAGPGESSDAREDLEFKIVRRKLAENSIALIAFIAVFVAIGIWTNGTFLDINARLLDVHSSVPILVLGFASLFALISGEFDLSIASISSMSCFLVIGLRVNQGLPFWAAIFGALLMGAAVGLFNGFLIEFMKVNAFIATLGVGAVISGIGYVYSKGTLISPVPGSPQLPSWFVKLGSPASKAPDAAIWIALALALVGLFMGLDRVRRPSWRGPRWLIVKSAVLAFVVVLLFQVAHIRKWVAAVSWLMLLMMALGALLWIVFQYTEFGRHMQAVGSNRAAARLAGVKVRQQVMKAFVCGGVVAAIGGVCLATLQGTASPDSSAAFLLPAFSAAFLSTVILSDGRFTVLGTVLGGVFVVWVGLGLIIGGLDPLWVNTINGVVLVAAVSLSTVVRARR